MSNPYDVCPPSPPSPETPPTFPNQGHTTQCFSPTLYYNTAQTYVVSCPAPYISPPISVTVPKDTYLSSVSLSDANNQAMAQAEATALALRLANPCVFATDHLLAEGGGFYILLEDYQTFIAIEKALGALILQETNGFRILLEDSTTFLTQEPI